MTRHLFLGGMADWATDLGAGETSTGGLSGRHALFIPGATVQFWDSASGGLQITDLLDMLNTPITDVTADSNGELPQIQGPATTPETWLMWADGSGDGSGPRRVVVATDFGDTLNGIPAGLSSTITNLTALTDIMPVVVVYDTTAGAWDPRPAVAGTRPVFWLGPTPPPIDATYMLNNVDFFFDWLP